MSYTVVVLVPPVPADDPEAWAVMHELIELEGPRPAVLQQLHDQFVSRFPCLCSLTDDQIDDGVWSDGPLINNFLHRTAHLGIVYSRVEEVLPSLVESANALGLVVFDEQTGRIYRP